MLMTTLFNERFVTGFAWPDGRVMTFDDPEFSYFDDSNRVGAYVTTLCPRCWEPASHLTRHVVEKHGDTDVKVIPARSGYAPPEWFQPDWI